jgi:hypothetical protein
LSGRIKKKDTKQSYCEYYENQCEAVFVGSSDIIYPAIQTREENIETAQKCGYHIVGTFVLPEKSWWDNYYTSIESKIPFLKIKYKDDEALHFIALEEAEIEMFRRYSNVYGYIFYIMQKN